jgi:hypothetical protein
METHGQAAVHAFENGRFRSFQRFSAPGGNTSGHFRAVVWVACVTAVTWQK